MFSPSRSSYYLNTRKKRWGSCHYHIWKFSGSAYETILCLVLVDPLQRHMFCRYTWLIESSFKCIVAYTNFTDHNSSIFDLDFVIVEQILARNLHLLRWEHYLMKQRGVYKSQKPFSVMAMISWASCKFDYSCPWVCCWSWNISLFLTKGEVSCYWDTWRTRSTC